ncbi:hypothetical protein WICMUC_001853 [Wickerhamomyces mucosus]|uniref:Glutathione S-transferase n=1 Tax=Wickerhamomyces mucosus TaxID=1378264 RepID=A0A9P8PRJ3_9ASCO|nr:hypothetical protein WICMUC_001853 [Wickerhamomyces mucosus]
MTLIDEGDPIAPKLEAPYLKLYNSNTSNGQKITIFLNLLKKNHFYRSIDIGDANEQKEPWYIKLNPNGRIPVLTHVNENGEIKTIHETGLILLYLADNFDIENKFSYKAGDKLWYEQLQWLFFQIASHSPLQGQAHHFIKFAKVNNEYGKKRYSDEVKRIYGVYDLRLKENNGWLVGDKLNIADISAFPWISRSHFLGVDSLEEWPYLNEWLNKLKAYDGILEGQDQAGIFGKEKFQFIDYSKI